MELPKGEGISGKIARGAISSIGGAIPVIGGLLSAGATAWSEAEQEQEQVNKVLQQWLQMLEDELREKGKTTAEVIARVTDFISRRLSANKPLLAGPPA
jgi:phage-related minor tail protein